MSIVGISISHDGTLSYVNKGKHLFAIGEERINRKSLHWFSIFHIELRNREWNAKKKDVKYVAISVNNFSWKSAETFAFVLTEDKKYYDIQNDKKPSDFFISDNEWKQIKSDDQCEKYVKKKIKILLKKNGINVPIYFYDHHFCHAASAYYSSGFANEKVLSITMDGEGDGLSASVNLCDGDKITKLSDTDRFNSAGGIYSAVTKKCGFKISRHEGKITGLAV